MLQKLLLFVQNLFQMKKQKKSQPSLKQDQQEILITSEEIAPDFTSLESKIFTDYKGNIYIGKYLITQEIKDILSVEAKYLEESKLWEILNASITNEAYTHALINSKDFDAVMFAKALHHWSFFIRNVVNKLNKK